MSNAIVFNYGAADNYGANRQCPCQNKDRSRKCYDPPVGHVYTHTLISRAKDPKECYVLERISKINTPAEIPCHLLSYYEGHQGYRDREFKKYFSLPTNIFQRTRFYYWYSRGYTKTSPGVYSNGRGHGPITVVDEIHEEKDPLECMPIGAGLIDGIIAAVYGELED